MPKVNWSQVQTGCEAAVKAAVGSAFGTVSSVVGPQIEAMVAIGQDIEIQHEQGKLTKREYESLRRMQKKALEGILSGYEGIGAALAAQAADAAWKVVAAALLKTAGIPFA
jgi:hypothetical protein